MSRIKDFDESVVIDDSFSSYIDGLLLGDGSLCIMGSNRRRGYITPSYSQACVESEWIYTISNYFKDCGIINQVHVTQSKRVNRGNEKPLYHIDTRRYKEFIDFHNRWYKRWYDIDSYPERFWHKDNGGEYYIWKKVVPSNINLSPMCVANWYMGDGSLSNRKSGYDTLILATNGFSRGDVEYLSELLGFYYDIDTKLNKKNEIEIYTPFMVNRFLDLVRCNILQCFKYKLNYYR